ncbi:MAG: DUF4159 domain-containing protein [Elusimicrobia bacterium]|nr:DUF4159 domain-containing protein [Elusimicrobiota bacterium]
MNRAKKSYGKPRKATESKKLIFATRSSFAFRCLLLPSIAFLCFPLLLSAGAFSLAELDLGAGCGIMESARLEILRALAGATSVEPEFAARKIKLSDAALFDEPFLTLSCAGAPESLDYGELRALRLYLVSGGTLFVNDASGRRRSPFAEWLRRTMELVLPESGFQPVAKDHSLLKSFFLISAPGGRFNLEKEPAAMEYSGRYAVIFSRNDLVGVWPKDSIGRYVYDIPAAGQRHSGEKLTLNILIYALTGSYKQDAVHQPFIMQRLRELDAGASP